ncbi:peptidase inhibitor family I36 protein [Streptomyces sp. NPDC000618]|uniref:peptidase inhibitor family I36 protein n=1 Tax=Streptomyces sp. NPDC000618 TaxID=3154265 RepID=UPI0033330816
MTRSKTLTPRRLLATAALVAGLVAPLAAQVPAAEAAPTGRADCKVGMLCLWDGKNYTGTRWEVPLFCGEYRWLPAIDKASSIYNRTGNRPTLFDEDNRVPRMFTLNPNTWVPDLSRFPSGRNSDNRLDQVSWDC